MVILEWSVSLMFVILLKRKSPLSLSLTVIYYRTQQAPFKEDFYVHLNVSNITAQYICEIAPTEKENRTFI